MLKYKAFLLMLFIPWILWGAWINNCPTEVTQPDGTKLSLQASGDEFFNWLHDAAGYTIVQSQTDGYYYYATKDNGEIVPSQYKVTNERQALVGISPKLQISAQEYKNKRAASAYIAPTPKERSATTGTLNNIVVYIRFSDQTEFTVSRSTFDQKFNSVTPGVSSLKGYYSEVSYQQLLVESTHYPVCEMNTNLSYVDSHPRGYYQPYNAITNNIGYTDGQASSREQTLIANAVEAIANQVPTSINIDNDNDNKVDNVCFIIRGGNGAWADLLWAHRTALYGENAYINGKRVYDYTFQPESQNDVTTLCHEMFHSLGAPDLYHYNDQSADGPASYWDIMNSGSVSMGAYMKYKYGHWLPAPQVISESIDYWVQPLQSPTRNYYRINSPYSTTQFFIVEYRKKVPGTYDSTIPNSGLLIYRIDSRYEGNASGPPDEVYIFRPGSTGSGGSASAANFSVESGRTMFDQDTDPASLLYNGTVSGITIYNIGTAGDSISFTLNPTTGTLLGSVQIADGPGQMQDVSLTLGSLPIEIGTDGLFEAAPYQGTYPLTASLVGYKNVAISNVTIHPNLVTSGVNVVLYQQDVPQNLRHRIEGGRAVLTWDYDLASNPELRDFQIYLSRNGNTFNRFRQTNNTEYISPLPLTVNYWYYVVAENNDGNSYASNTIQVQPLSLEDQFDIPQALGLTSVYPNPFSKETVLTLRLQETGSALIKIYDVKGRLVSTIAQQNAAKGEQQITWNGTDNRGNSLPSGIYFAKLTSGKQTSTKKLVIIK